ncbi:non-homologous end-joining DNA ligase [Halomonas rhizosphaerae]|uniref:DNA ligase (ATP) n=1 Tax=Halomonas rhizosphaerae TaxID=3043296 RepID=A0ABT6UY49_9GAMM|nr:non-homologous end-joining DNA ligase [Halomonas rhizosphaerae]MDI5890856.1 non-homologous end-joining DNA ligase [Halomonas rhizosphaerae]
MHDALAALPAEARSKLKRAPQPGFVEPMKATLVHEPFSDPDWIYERKLDGERCLLHKKGRTVTLYSRNEKKKNSTYPEIAEAVGSLDGSCILDSEIVTFDGKVTSFKRLQKRIHRKAPGDDILRECPVYAYAFDILYLDGYDLTDLPLRERKKVLRRAFEWASPLRVLPYRNAEGEAYLKEASKKGWEGLIAKDARSSYVHRRSRQWLKFKCGHRQEMVIAGYTEPKGERVGFGALLLGYYEDGELRYAGRVGTGFDDAFLTSFHKTMQREERDTSPYADDMEEDADIHWIEPRFVGEVGFTEWTQDGCLRHPRFLGLRDDKDPQEVRRESAQ